MRKRSEEEEALNRAIGARMRERRELQGLPVEYVAGKLGVMSATLESWEAGTKPPTIIQIGEWARYLDLELEWVFYGPEGRPARTH